MASFLEWTKRTFLEKITSRFHAKLLDLFIDLPSSFTVGGFFDVASLTNLRLNAPYINNQLSGLNLPFVLQYGHVRSLVADLYISHGSSIITLEDAYIVVSLSNQRASEECTVESNLAVLLQHIREAAAGILYSSLGSEGILSSSSAKGTRWNDLMTWVLRYDPNLVITASNVHLLIEDHNAEDSTSLVLTMKSFKFRPADDSWDVKWPSPDAGVDVDKVKLELTREKLQRKESDQDQIVDSNDKVLFEGSVENLTLSWSPSIPPSRLSSALLTEVDQTRIKDLHSSFGIPIVSNFAFAFHLGLFHAEQSKSSMLSSKWIFSFPELVINLTPDLIHHMARIGRRFEKSRQHEKLSWRPPVRPGEGTMLERKLSARVWWLYAMDLLQGASRIHELKMRVERRKFIRILKKIIKHDGFEPEDRKPYDIKNPIIQLFSLNAEDLREIASRNPEIRFIENTIFSHNPLIVAQWSLLAMCEAFYQNMPSTTPLSKLILIAMASLTENEHLPRTTEKDPNISAFSIVEGISPARASGQKESFSWIRTYASSRDSLSSACKSFGSYFDADFPKLAQLRKSMEEFGNFKERQAILAGLHFKGSRNRMSLWASFYSAYTQQYPQAHCQYLDLHTLLNFSNDEEDVRAAQFIKSSKEMDLSTEEPLPSILSEANPTLPWLETLVEPGFSPPLPKLMKGKTVYLLSDRIIIIITDTLNHPNRVDASVQFKALISEFVFGASMREKVSFDLAFKNLDRIF
eukprot:GHVP01058299.1.p1 GENE.GHVP01058299.1~~GHVP01058299.1.p1  ORF type:complete len:748 (+),score=118.48 GHVP01058299.1:3222-5465(+)